MLCKYCNTEIGDNSSVCPGCGKPVALMSGQFENIVEVKNALKSIVDEHGLDLFKDSKRFTGLLNDYMPEYEKERRLIRNVIANDLISQMMNEPDQKLAIVKAREYMLNDMFLSETAGEFVLDCFTYMLGWSFTPEMPESAVQQHTAPSGTRTVKNDFRPKVQSPVSAEKKNEPPKEIKQKYFKSFDALKYKILPNVKIPEGYTVISKFVFDSFGFLRTVRLPSTVMVIEEYAFSECKRLRSIELPQNLKKIERSAFSSCSALESVSIPYGILQIEEGTFSFCRSLTEVDIPSSVSNIGNQAFTGCESLNELYIPDSVKFIDANAFAYCSNIIIRCIENSYVHKFCMTNGIQFSFVNR